MTGVSDEVRRPARAVSLRSVLLFTWLGSLGTGCVTNGVFFVTKQQHDFSPAMNFALGIAMGATYVLGALGVGPALRAIAARFESISTRAVTAWVNIGLGLICAAPVLAPRPEMMWVFAVIYLPLTGGLWPIVESYLSGGRSGRSLRHAIGGFNLSWASAVAVSFWGMALLLADHPLWVIAAMGLVHLGCIPIILLWPQEPPRHVEGEIEPHPKMYERLLPCFRWLLVLSYVLMAAVNPLLPWRLEDVGLDVSWRPVLASAWMTSRVGMFLLFQQWHGWHGRWRTPIWTGGAMLVGFAMVLLAPGLWSLAAALAFFGVGVGGVYCGALYYAMVVGSAEVDAGGKHEATIGMGYTLGPLSGLAGWGLVAAGLLVEEQVALGILGVVGAIALVALIGAARSSAGRGAPAP